MFVQETQSNAVIYGKLNIKEKIILLRIREISDL